MKRYKRVILESEWIGKDRIVRCYFEVNGNEYKMRLVVR